MIGTTIVLGTVTIGGGTNTIQSIRPYKKAGTKKQIYGQSYNETVIPGRNKEWIITIVGRLSGINYDTDRTTLQGYHDDSRIRRYNDGIRDIDVIIIPGSLVFDDRAPARSIYDYSMTLVEYNQ